MIESIAAFFSGLPTWELYIGVAIVFTTIFSLFKKAVKFAIYLAVLTILVIVIYKLLTTP